MPRLPLEDLTEDEKFKLQEQQEQELGCLQRQYNLLERDRQSFVCGVKLGRFNKVLGLFKKEHGNIETDLEVATGPCKKRQDAKDSDCLTKLLCDYDFYQEEVNKKRQYILEIEGQIRGVGKEVVRLRSLQITDRQHEDRIWAAIKTAEQLTSKVDVQNKKFGTICAENRAMMNEIRRMLWERNVFMKVWNKMIHKLVLGKKFMMDLIEQATIAYDQREQWMSKLQALRLKAHYDFITHIEEMRELKRKQNNSKKLETFFNSKGKKRVMKDLQHKETMKRTENKLKIKKSLKEYRQFMDDILEFTKENQVEDIARKYYIQEAENFSLFNRVNTLMAETELLGDKLEDIQAEIDKEKAIQTSRSEHQKVIIQKLETEFETATHEVEEAKKEIVMVDDYISTMLSGIENLFKICRCDNDPILQLLDNNMEVNVYNVFLYVEMVEKMIHKALVELYSHEKVLYDKRKITANQRIVSIDSKKGEVLLVESLATPSPCPLCIEHEFVMDVIDTVQHAMTRDEAKVALKERLNSRGYTEHLHTVSNCFLPQSREIIQKRFQ